MRQNPPHSFAQKFVQGTILSRLWTAVFSGVNMAASFLILAVLSVHEFGLYQLVLSAVAAASIVTVNFFDNVVANDISLLLSDKKKPEAKRLFLELAILKIGAGAIVTIGLFFGAAYVAGFYDNAIASYVRIISFIVTIQAFRSSASLFLDAVVSLKAIGVEAVEGIAKLSLISGLYFFSFLTLSGVIAATVVGSLVALIYVSVPFMKEYRSFFHGIALGTRWMFPDAIRLYGFWMLLRQAVSRVSKPIRPWLIVAFLNAEAVALTAFAINLVTLIKDFMPKPSSSLLAWEVGNQKRLSFIFARGVKYSFFLSLAAAASGLIVIPPLVGFFFPKYLAALPLFLFFLLTVPVHGISGLESSLLVALREQKLLAARLITEVIMSIVILASLLPVIGILAVGVEINATVFWRIQFYYRRLVKKYPFLKIRLRSLVRFDDEDRAVCKRGLEEARSFLHI